MAALNAGDFSRSSIRCRSGALLLALLIGLSCSSIKADDISHAMGIALSPQLPGLGSVSDLHCFGHQLALMLEDQFVDR